MTIVETQEGKFVAFKTDDYGYINIYERSNVDFSYEYSRNSLYDYLYPSRVKAAVSGNYVYFIHRYYLYQHDLSTYSTWVYNYNDFTDVSEILGNSGSDDNYLFFAKTDGSIWKLSLYDNTYSEVSITSQYSTQCPTNVTGAVDISRNFENVYFLTSEGVICKASDYGYSNLVLE